jgi:demethylmenaquinone methyltransferase/2-methoxy-6-polyprenyl-1,4-benzoquinol methylase
MTEQPSPRGASEPAARAAAAASIRPHPVLSGYYADEDGRRAFLDQIFDETSADYDRIEKLIGFGSGPWYRRQALRRAGLVADMRVVDVGIGTGLVAREAVAIVGDPTRVIGVDPSAGMMACARLPAGVRLIEGVAEAIPLGAGCADFVSMGFALRHVGSLAAAFSEFHRILAPGGRLVVLELTKPSGRLGAALLKCYLRAVVPSLARMSASSERTPMIWRYYWDTIEACVAPATVVDQLRAAGFGDVRRHVELGIFSEYTARRER